MLQEHELAELQGSQSEGGLDTLATGLRSYTVGAIELDDLVRREHAIEARFEVFFETSPLGVALGDIEGNVYVVNDAFRRVFGLMGIDARSARSFNLFDLAELEAPVRRLVDDALAGVGWCSVDAVRRVEARALRWHFARLAPSRSDEIGLLVQVEDLGAPKAGEEEPQRRTCETNARRLIDDLRERVGEPRDFFGMVSRSERMMDIFELIPQVAETGATVLVWGESGTGKELVARSLHKLSPRSREPFVALNCSALPDTLLESELFGYEAGAFTGAKKDKPGKFALAEGGTLLLDEIGDIAPAVQVKLLRVLQERCYEPLGSSRSVKADVRVIAATNKNLKDMVKEGTFRQDLFYRINVLNIRLPSLLERKGDIPTLCNHFVARFNKRFGKRVRSVSREALDVLTAYDFPGNIRELENVLEHAFVFCTGPAILPEHLPRDLRRSSSIDEKRRVLASVSSFADLERLYLESVLAESNGSKIEAARRLGVHKTTLFRKLKKLGIHT